MQTGSAPGANASWAPARRTARAVARRRGESGARVAMQRLQPRAAAAVHQSLCRGTAPARLLLAPRAPPARACCAPVLDVKAAERKVRVTRVKDNVLCKRSLVSDLVQRQHRHTVACAVTAGHAAGRHHIGRDARDADAHGHCALGGRAQRERRAEGCCSAACAPPRRAGAHAWACCRCRRSWGRRSSAAPAQAPAERARGAGRSPLPVVASFAPRAAPARLPAQEGRRPAGAATAAPEGLSGEQETRTAFRRPSSTQDARWRAHPAAVNASEDEARSAAALAPPPAADGGAPRGARRSVLLFTLALVVALRCACCGARRGLLLAQLRPTQDTGVIIIFAQRCAEKRRETHRSACRSACARTSAAYSSAAAASRAFLMRIMASCEQSRKRRCVSRRTAAPRSVSQAHRLVAGELLQLPLALLPHILHLTAKAKSKARRASAEPKQRLDGAACDARPLATHPVVVVQQVPLRRVERVEGQARLGRRVLVGVHAQRPLPERAAQRTARER